MRDAPGVGLAAPQLGEAMQACVIEVENQLYELVNPAIVRSSGDDRDLEGCLSIPGYVAYVTRREKRLGASPRTGTARRSRSPDPGCSVGRSSTSSITSTASCTSTISTRWTS